jgi:hypothetical protein
MGFGYPQARAAGLSQFRRERSVRHFNEEVMEAQEVRQLRKEIDRDPEWGPFARAWIEEGHCAANVLEAIDRAKHYMTLKRQGVSLDYRWQYRP